MSESSVEVVEAPAPKEVYTPAEIFEHLFPGNSFLELPDFDRGSVASYLFDRILGLSVATTAIPEANLKIAAEQGEEFRARVGIGILDKFTLTPRLNELTPIFGTTNSPCFNEHSFEGLIDIRGGEHLGGAARQKISGTRHRNLWGSKTVLDAVATRVVGERFYNRKLTYIGILSRGNKPCGVIAFLKGEGLRAPKNAEEVRIRSTPTPQLQPV